MPLEAPLHPTNDVTHQQNPKCDYHCKRRQCHYFLELSWLDKKVALIEGNSVGSIWLSLGWRIGVVRMLLPKLYTGPLFLSCLVCNHSAERD